MAIYLKEATFVDWQTFAFKHSHLLVEPGVGGKVRPVETIPAAAERHADDVVLECRNKLVTKSFACGHHHVYSALARGMPAPPQSPENFSEILKYIWWRLDKALDIDMIEASALVTAAASAMRGVTFVIDHHASPYAVRNALGTIAGAFDRVGISHLLCYELSDRDGESAREEGLAETEAYLKSGGQGLVGLHASFTVGTDLLERAISLAERFGSGIHVHAAEDPIDQQHTLEHYGSRVIERFHGLGILDLSKTILAHCLHINDRERRLIRDSNAWVVQNTESNWNNGVGAFDPRGLGERIMLGTDGMHSDMLQSARAAFLSGQARGGTSAAEIYNRFRRVHRYLEQNHVEGDGDNNLVILDYDPPTEIKPDNFLSHFFYGIESAHVDSVIANGKLIVRSGELLTVDRHDIHAFSREMSQKLWQKMEKSNRI